jgi:hypothetical protein
MNLTGNSIFITGGGSGIGRGLAEALHSRGNLVIISGRRRSHLEATTKANPGMASVELDLQDPKSIASAAKKLIATVRIAERYFLSRLFCFRDTEQSAAAQDWSTRVDRAHINLLGNCGGDDRFCTQQLYAARFLLGLAEFAPGMLLYLTYWFRQREQAQAVGLYLSGMPIATVLGAPISGFILDHIHWVGLSSWRWLLILEGTPAIVCGFVTYFLLPGRPEEAKFLAADET